jgi:hypothetical protein
LFNNQLEKNIFVKLRVLSGEGVIVSHPVPWRAVAVLAGQTLLPV